MKNFFKDSNTRPFAITIAILLVAIIAFAVWFICMGEPKDAIERKPNCYALATIVREVNRETDTVTCEDYNGNLWEFYGAEDWQEGDCANLLMDSMGTEHIYDDEIRGATYGAWTLTK